MSVTEELRSLLGSQPASPFLFVGSGLGRRYLGLEDWEGLLTRFCSDIKPFGYYRTMSNKDMPRAASLMADDFNRWWWESPAMKESRNEFSDNALVASDSLKYEIAKYVSAKSIDDSKDLPFYHEIECLQEICVDGIITTNWDSLVEDLFPDYRVFVGQGELLFSNPQSIGEVCKIHGCASSSTSLVLTEEDYSRFQERNAYLAAKLVTIFVEHPIVFIGYSLNDPHIRDVIVSIAKCLDSDKMEIFQNNLFFVEWITDISNQSDQITRTTLVYDGLSVSINLIRIRDFSDGYKAMSGSKRKIPARLIRFFKEQMYEIIRNPTEGEGRVSVIDSENIDEEDDVEFVIGIGVAQRREEFARRVETSAKADMAKKGYVGVEVEEMLKDYFSDAPQFQSELLLGSAFRAFARSSRTFLPVYKYLHEVGVLDQGALDASNFEGAKKFVKGMSKAKYGSAGYAQRFRKAFAGKSTDQIIAEASGVKEAVRMLTHQPDGELDIERLGHFLKGNFPETYNSDYIKLLCRYDKLKYGFNVHYD